MEWLQVFVKFFPASHASTEQVSIETPEKAKLPIPSRIPCKTCIQYGLEGLVDIEYSLRVGQAHDILAEIHELIIGQSYNTRIVHTEFHGQNMHTRAHAFVTRFQLDKMDTMHRYNFIRRRLITLGMSPTDADLQELTSAHITTKNTPEGLTESDEDQWITEIRCVQWMREHADLDCWTKEIAHASDVQTGAAAYAYKVADVYTKLADHCIKEWEKALKKVVENWEEDCRMREREDELAQEEEARI
ncbi:hypothetical protein EV421DRAFT_1907212 [Armillaria borealis]|uniref:Uncharacterized protein n=1 Tax=Armillaria borealis TaxID=47425 RepID=A0AA39J8S0_9AGAR|nr:hypothetical protein EV421DRAFT_1907212 [Armillaria borealis]